MRQTQFWNAKPLYKMTKEEWDSLCDCCGICCLHKKENEETGEIENTSVACRHLDIMTCRCTIYKERLRGDNGCLKLTHDRVKEIIWLPDTCAYRLVLNGEPLEWWHPLISGDSETVHRAGISVRDRAVSASNVHPDDLYGSGWLSP